MPMMKLVDYRRDFPERRVARAGVGGVAGRDRQARLARGGKERRRVNHGAVDHRTTAQREAAVGEALLEIDHDDASLAAEADAVGVEADLLVGVAHLPNPKAWFFKVTPKHDKIYFTTVGPHKEANVQERRGLWSKERSC